MVSKKAKGPMRPRESAEHSQQTSATYYEKQRLKRWQLVSDLQNEIATRTTSPCDEDNLTTLLNPMFMLDRGWQAAMREIGVEPEDVRSQTTADQPWSDMEPVHRMFDLVCKGIYPPPELLMACGMLFHKYLAEGLDSEPSTLEERLLGQSVPKAGTYAARFVKMRINSLAGLEVFGHRQQGKTQAEAVELVWHKWFPGGEKLCAAIKSIARNDANGRARRHALAHIRKLRRQSAIGRQ